MPYFSACLFAYHMPVKSHLVKRANNRKVGRTSSRFSSPYHSQQSNLKAHITTNSKLLMFKTGKHEHLYWKQITHNLNQRHAIILNIFKGKKNSISIRLLQCKTSNMMTYALFFFENANFGILGKPPRNAYKLHRSITRESFWIRFNKKSPCLIVAW